MTVTTYDPVTRRISWSTPWGAAWWRPANGRGYCAEPTLGGAVEAQELIRAAVQGRDLTRASSLLRRHMRAARKAVDAADFWSRIGRIPQHVREQT